MSSDLLAKKVQVLIKLREYKIVEKDEVKEGQLLTIKNKKGETFLLWAVSEVSTVGIRFVNQLSKKVTSKELTGGILISNGKYTYSARANSKKKGIELIPSKFPAFNIFDHDLVPKHQILTPEEKENVLKQYKVKPYQIPFLKTSDTIAIVIGAKAGDLLKIERKSQTAGEHTYYRYVVEG